MSVAQYRATLRLETQDAAQGDRVKGGQKSEALVESLHDLCASMHIAYVHKVPTPYVIVGHGKGGTFHARHSKKTGADYRGVMLDGSQRSIRAECKSDADPAGRVYLRELRPNQREDLDAAHARGDVAVLLVVLGRGLQATAFAVPWSEARECVGLGPAELRPWRVRPGEAYLARWVR